MITTLEEYPTSNTPLVSLYKHPTLLFPSRLSAPPAGHPSDHRPRRPPRTTPALTPLPLPVLGVVAIEHIVPAIPVGAHQRRIRLCQLGIRITDMLLPVRIEEGMEVARMGLEVGAASGGGPPPPPPAASSTNANSGGGGDWFELLSSAPNPQCARSRGGISRVWQSSLAHASVTHSSFALALSPHAIDTYSFSIQAIMTSFPCHLTSLFPPSCNFLLGLSYL
ncbi:hypothetical protein BKA70DRAFT_681018 [Coprinopsis sp. MPI-PUGE-AT-0042]|nr:hypothetical protein BKA70DRAFT_681018 [Coprinopsis sp. MPI-PUGE-AT-0042]